MSTISIRNVGMRYGTIHALRDVSLVVEQGELLTILGPSGSGKSTLLGIVSGLSMPTSGSLSIDGTDVTTQPPNERNIGLVFQNYALFPTMTVQENIAFPLRVRRRSKAEIRNEVGRALELVQMSAYGRRRVSELSGGQQQRIALARALVFKPAVLLLDEPLGALDRKLRQEVQVELRELQRSLGITTVMVTHDQEEALTLSDRIAVLNDGSVQQVGTPRELYRQPATPFVADFFGGANLIAGTVTGDSLVAGGQSFPIVHGRGGLGGTATGAINPGDLRVVAAGATTIEATVRDAVYLGHQVRYHLRVASGQELIALQYAGSDCYSAGDAVSISYETDKLWVMPPSGTLPNDSAEQAAGATRSVGDPARANEEREIFQ